MKNFTLLAAAALVAGSAAAQDFNVNPSVETVLANGTPSTVCFVQLDDASITKFEKAGAKVTNFGPNGDNQNLYIWENTFDAGEASYPGVGDHMDGYVSLVVGKVGWSGAGWNIAGAGVNTSNFDDNTHFHMAYLSPGTACPSLGFILGNPEGSVSGKPGNFAIGASFDDNGNKMASVGAASKNDWQAVDFTLGDLKKMSPNFELAKVNAWTGNILAVLAGGTTGQTVAFDAIYFYNIGNGGVEGVTVDAAAPTQFYNLQGVEMTGNLTPGIYVARQGNKVTKISVK